MASMSDARKFFELEQKVAKIEEVLTAIAQKMQELVLERDSDMMHVIYPKEEPKAEEDAPKAE